MKSMRIGYLYVFLASAFFAFIAVLGKAAINLGIAPFDLIILQYATSVLIMLVYFAFKDIKMLKLSKQELKNVIIQGIIGSSGTTLFNYLALEKINAGIASMLLFTHPVLISIYFLISRTKKINIVNNGALLLAVLGSIMVLNIFAFDAATVSLIGIVYGLLASACYAFFNIYAEVAFKKAEPLVTTFYTSAIILLSTLLINPAFFRFDFVLSMDIIIYILELAVIAGILPVVFLYKGIRIVGADRGSIVATSELPITIIVAYLILGEKMDLVQVIGIFFIVASIIILQNENNILLWINKIKRSG